MSDNEEPYDMVVFGAGSAGYAAALRGAQLGLSVALVERHKLGGTCLHNGCIPTKAMLHAAELADQARQARDVGVRSSFQGIDMDALHAYKNSVVSSLCNGLTGLVDARGITYVEGEGRLSSATSVDVGGRRLTGRHVVLATGSVPRTLPGLEIDGRRVISSDHALTLDHVPKSVIVLGGGVIGVEFASAWSSFGAQVTVVEALPHLVPTEDETVSSRLETEFLKRGITPPRCPLRRQRVHTGRHPRPSGGRRSAGSRPPARGRRTRPCFPRPGFRGGRRRNGQGARAG